LSCVNGTSSSSIGGRTLEQAEAEAAVTVASTDSRGANKPQISLMDLRDALQVGLMIFTSFSQQLNIIIKLFFSLENVFLVLRANKNKQINHRRSHFYGKEKCKLIVVAKRYAKCDISVLIDDGRKGCSLCSS